MEAGKGVLMALSFWNPLKQTLAEALQSEWFIWEWIPRSLDRAAGVEGLLGDHVLQGHLPLERGNWSVSPPSPAGF